MKKSIAFWKGMTYLVIIPFLALDIPKNVVDWRDQVSDQMLDVAFNTYHLSNSQKFDIVSRIQHNNIILITGIWLRGIFSVGLFISAIILFIKSRREERPALASSFAIVVILLTVAISLKIFTWYSFTGDDRIRLLKLSPSDTTLENIYLHNFQGKVLYVDFWGTTCPPCVSEFLNFTKPLKESYKNNRDIAYLYVCGGHQFVWCQQLKEYDIAGYHIFLDSKEYEKLYREAVKNTKATVLMPHYLIMDKQGKVAITDAARPSSGDTIKIQLNKYLAMK